MVRSWTEKHEDHAKAALVRLASDALAAGDHGAARVIRITLTRRRILKAKKGGG